MKRPMNAEAADTLRGYEEMIRRGERLPPQAPGSMGEPWCPVMTPQEKAALEQRIKELGLPF